MLGAIIAMGALAASLFYLDKTFPELQLFSDIQVLGILFGSVFFTGILISLICTYFATSRFLNLRTDALYY